MLRLQRLFPRLPPSLQTQATGPLRQLALAMPPKTLHSRAKPDEFSYQLT